MKHVDLGTQVAIQLNVYEFIWGLISYDAKFPRTTPDTQMRSIRNIFPRMDRKP